MKRAFNDLQGRWKAGSRVSKILAVAQGIVLCLILLALTVWGTAVDATVGTIVWVFFVAVIQTNRESKNGVVDFKLFLDWFVIDWLSGLVFGMLLISIVATISLNWGG